MMLLHFKGKVSDMKCDLALLALVYPLSSLMALKYVPHADLGKTATFSALTY